LFVWFVLLLLMLGGVSSDRPPGEQETARASTLQQMTQTASTVQQEELEESFKIPLTFSFIVLLFFKR